MKRSTRSFTKTEVFVDTSGFYALLVQGDPMHQRANDFVVQAGKIAVRFATTDYILDETATLLKARGSGHLADAFFGTVFDSAACHIEWMDPDRFLQTRKLFLKHQDQNWSFTDCFSFWLMRLLGLSDALTSDAHFRHA